MTAAALALALALFVAPGAPRHRLGATAPPTPAARRRLVLFGLAGCGLAIAIVAPVGASAAFGMITASLLMREHRSRTVARRNAESIALQGALSVLVGELRVGAHPVVAFETAAGEVSGTTATSLRMVAARARLGADVAAGLRSAANDSALPAHWYRLASCWQLAQTHGLAIVALVRAAQRDVVERERFAAKVSADMAGARATTAILAGLPVLGVGLGQLIGAQPLSFLLSDGLGGWLLVIGVMLACAGVWWSDRITRGVLR